MARTQAIFTALLGANQTRAHPLSATTLQRIREVPRAALNAAIRRDLITHNPARWVGLPTPHHPRGVIWTDARITL
ncbi:MAG: hypothetical protein J2P19_16745 [Pseudonocardia sp.]|nr:hypothetical protein [Pseudonocardia sp.]